MSQFKFNFKFIACLGFKPGAAEWKAHTNPLSYLIHLLNTNSFAQGIQCTKWPSSGWEESDERQTILFDQDILYFNSRPGRPLEPSKQCFIVLLKKVIPLETKTANIFCPNWLILNSVTRSGDLLDFGQLWNAFGNT